MDLKTTATVVLIFIGACVMGTALLATRQVLALVSHSRLASKWRALFMLMGFFLVGYIASLALSLSGHAGILALLTGVIFLFGAAFVYLVVHVGRQTIEELLTTTMSKAHFAKTIETMADALIVLDPDMTVRTVNQSACELSGYSREELIGRNAAEVFADCDLFQDPGRLLRGGSRGKVEKECRTKEGQDRTVAFSWSLMRAEDGQPDGVVCLVQDISDRKQAELALQESRQRLLHSATHDSLTGLPNRELVIDRIDRVVEQARRQPASRFAVLFLDLDHFKAINDSLGHAVGDELIRTVADILKTCVRGADTLGRMGGDEFVMLLTEIHDVSDAVRVVERILEKTAEPVRLQGHELHIKVSVGIALSETGYDTTQDLLRDADIAMYRAKASGGSSYEIFDATMRDRMVDRIRTEAELRQALREDEFEIHYQPIMNLRTDTVAGVEALLRWNHPERGLVPPLQFIPLAEETGLIVEIDRWVLRNACRQVREWQLEFPEQAGLGLAVNLASAQFLMPDLVPFVAEVLAATGLSATDLRIEITESTFVENVESTTSTLIALRDMGVRIEIDDFGTGYSSLSYLHRLPVDTLKVDQSFVRNMTDSGTDLAIVHTIILLAQALDIRAVAEGVETEEQRDQLRGLDCDYAQGYLFSRPLPAPQIRARFGAAGIDPALASSLPPKARPPVS